MRKLTFERAILIVLTVIIFISTTEIREKYIGLFLDKFFPKDKPVISDAQSGKNWGFPTMLLAADNLYTKGDYENAAKQYFALTLNNALSIDQKFRANFRLGICQYNLKNYQKAFESFVKAASFNPNDSIIYNNAAVSAYSANDIKSAIEYQTKALEINPAIEYYYNLARIYEDNEQYDLAANNYLAVAIAEQNLTETDKIDPVRVKEKVARLMPSIHDTKESKVLIAYKLNSTVNEVLTINDNEMHIKPGDFEVTVKNQNGTRNIMAEYNRKKYDPYNLISEVIWTVYKNGKQIYKKSSEKFSMSATESGNYEVKLSIKDNANKESFSTKTVKIKKDQSTIEEGVKDAIVIKPPTTTNTKAYVFSIYEQLFESDFNVNSTGFTDKYNVVWGKDSGVETTYNKKLAVDKLSSLNVNNTSGKYAGIWINLDSLLENGNIKGKTVVVSFYGRKITQNAEVFFSARVKANNNITPTNKYLSFPFQFEQKSIKVDIPEDATGFTISIKTNSDEKFNIDGFTIIN